MSVSKITTFILLCIPVNLYAGVYKWVDAKGNVTYSSKPPPTGAKQQKIETIRSLGSTPAPQRTYSQSNRNSTQQSYQSQNYSQSQQPTRSTEDEALRQKIIQEAGTPYKGARGLTANQRNTLAAMNGVNVSSGDSYSNSNNSYSAPMPQRQPASTHMTSCDGSGCWDNQGNRYNGNNGTYYNNGRVCRDIGGQMQCN
ncbi:DUF4124 domain-containing protein [Acinetobacter bereziniae]|uniref:DUF4124 domain-containing protein n=1 Tax=Acinetobacter bereziniae TaxID=106648 RepID=UPI001D0D840E|nr:DUF4124 domain-containing protein [Acinetobacter bereziniae]